MKILIVSDSVIGNVLAVIVASESIEAILSSHKEAAFTFAAESPTHVIICDCGVEEINEKSKADISKSASGQKIFFLGFGKSDDAGHLQMPLNIKDLKKIWET